MHLIRRKKNNNNEKKINKNNEFLSINFFFEYLSNSKIVIIESKEYFQT